MALTEQETLTNILKSPEQGGGVNPGGSLGAGADVPATLEKDPALRTLLEQEIQTRMGKSGAAQATSAKTAGTFGTADATTAAPEASPSGVTTSESADIAFDDSVSRLDQLESSAGGGDNILAPSLDAGAAGFGQTEDLIAKSRALNEQQLATQISNIQTNFSSRKDEQRGVTKGRVGATRNLLAATGASTFASGQQAITGEVQRGQKALAELAAMEAQAIQVAKQAAAGNDVALLEKSIANAEAARNAQNEVRQQSFQNLMDLRQDARAESSAQKSDAAQVMNSIGALSPSAIEGLDPQQLLDIEKAAGMPGGYMNAFIETQKGIANAASDEARFEQGSKLLNLALKLPSGTEFEVGDFTVTGLDAGDRKIFQSVDGAGNVTLTTVDPATGDVINNVTLPGIAAASGGSGGGGGGGSRGGGGGGGAATTLEADLLAQAASKIGTEDADGNIITSEMAYQLMLAVPEIAGDFKAQERLSKSLDNLNSLGDGNFRYIEHKDPDTGVTTSITPFNADNGSHGDAVPLEQLPPPPTPKPTDQEIFDDRSSIGRFFRKDPSK